MQQNYCFFEMILLHERDYFQIDKSWFEDKKVVEFCINKCVLLRLKHLYHKLVAILVHVQGVWITYDDGRFFWSIFLGPHIRPYNINPP